MTLPSSGAISINNINTELGVASGTARSLGETSSRNLAGVASGAISLSNFYGKSNVQEIVFDNSAAAWGTPQNWNLWNIMVYRGIAITSSKVKVILRNITITATATSGPALAIGTGWPAGTELHVYLENCNIFGYGGAGGAGGYGGAGYPGGAGGNAVVAASFSGTITIEMGAGAYIYAGGGGGGGSGGTLTSNCPPQNGCTYNYGTGAAGTRGAGTQGGKAGNGGNYGAAGGSGAANYYGAGAGGAGGAALVGSSIVNKINFNANYWGALAG